MTESNLKNVVRRILEHPNGTVCKHWMLSVLLSELEDAGAVHSREFVKAVVCADDLTALALLPSETLGIWS